MSRINYIDDIQEGKAVFFYENGGKEQEGNFKDNKPIGDFFFYDKNGLLIKTKVF